MEQKEDEPLSEEIERYQQLFAAMRKEAAKVLVGQDKIVSYLIEALIARGHVLVEGVPGIGKTLLLKVFATITGSQFSRIQFTPDLLPTDILGITTYEEGKGFYTIKGPVFANFVLADEINRSPPKVQSALLEAMQEYQVTIGKETFILPNPFFVMATQNPIENVGTYKLPEAQIDRFLYKLFMDYPSMEEEQKILRSNVTTKKFADFELHQILNPDELIRVQAFVNRISLNTKIEQYIIRLTDATRKPQKYNITGGRYMQFGASPRSSIGLFISAKAHALINGRSYVVPNDVKEVATNILRHRILLNFEGEAEGIKTDQIIAEILKKVPIL
ncbi:MAG: MoxR family ATPase [Nanoarchaeota archaeon]